MKRYILASTVSILLVTLLLSAASIDIQEPSITMIVAPGGIETATMHIKNFGLSSLDVNITHNLDLIDNDGDRIVLSFSDPGPIAPNATASVTLTADADPKIDLEVYTGKVTVRDAVSGESDTLDLTIEVQPDLCDFGVVGDDLELEIEDPEQDEEFEPGETINVDVTVKNVGNDDIRTQVGVFLFSDKLRVANAFSEIKNIEDDEEDDFQVSLQIPLDSRQIDEDEDFSIFIKAFDDDHEQFNCVQKRVDISIRLPSRKVVIDKESTRFLPSLAACGDSVIANARVINIGSKDNNRVSLTLSNPELGISMKSDIFKLEAFSSDEDNTATRQFTVNIPGEIASKVYFFALGADYDGGLTTHHLPVEVIGCDTPSTLLQQGAIIATIAPVQSKIVTRQASLTSVPIKIINRLDTRETFIIALSNIAELGVSAPKTILLGPGQESTLFIDLRVNEDAQPGTHTAVIEARVQGLIAASETVAIDIEEQKDAEENVLVALFQSIPLVAWIAIDLIVIAVLIIIIRTVIKNTKH